MAEAIRAGGGLVGPTIGLAICSGERVVERVAWGSIVLGGAGGGCKTAWDVAVEPRRELTCALLLLTFVKSKNVMAQAKMRIPTRDSCREVIKCSIKSWVV